MYVGALFHLGLTWARQHDHRVLILSAKYGWVRPEQIIERYDERLRTPYRGHWPEGQGVYVGGYAYFGHAPARFAPLVPAARSQGDWVAGVRQLLRNVPPVRRNVRPQREGPHLVTYVLYRLLSERRVTVPEALAHLVAKFPDHAPAGLLQTIRTQLRQTRMGVERQCTVHRDGVGRYWVTPGLPERERTLLDAVEERG